MTSSKFWQTVGVSHNLEDEYLARHQLTDGVIEFLESVHSRGIEVWCLSNDLAEWAKKLRVRFKLEKYISGFVISGDVGLRKPDPAIFTHLLGRLKAKAGDAVFIDDSPKNLDSAAKLGFKTILFDAPGLYINHPGYETVKDFNELLRRMWHYF
jgi:HAD superfamily hydrolase (TIGR01509 family)